MIKRRQLLLHFQCAARDREPLRFARNEPFWPLHFHENLDDAHGGHQGGIVDMPDGTDYGFIMKDSGTIGRMTYISPIFWSNGWPVWGTSNAPGQVPATAPMPDRRSAGLPDSDFG